MRAVLSWPRSRRATNACLNDGQAPPSYTRVAPIIVVVSARHRAPVDHFEITEARFAEPLADFLRAVPVRELRSEAIASSMQGPCVVIRLNTRISPLTQPIENHIG